VCPLGIGIGLVVQVLTLIGQNSVSMKDMATASATIDFVKSIGGVFGVSVCGSIFDYYVSLN
jgi:hypothetical protein